jgi:hypothetical protein
VELAGVSIVRSCSTCSNCLNIIRPVGFVIAALNTAVRVTHCKYGRCVSSVDFKIFVINCGNERTVYLTYRALYWPVVQNTDSFWLALKYLLVTCRRFHKIAKSGCWSRHVCPSGCLHGTTRPQLDRFSWSMVNEYFSKNKICQEDPGFIQIRQEYRYFTWRSVNIYNHNNNKHSCGSSAPLFPGSQFLWL